MVIISNSSSNKPVPPRFLLLVRLALVINNIQLPNSRPNTKNMGFIRKAEQGCLIGNVVLGESYFEGSVSGASSGQNVINDSLTNPDRSILGTCSNSYRTFIL